MNILNEYFSSKKTAVTIKKNQVKTRFVVGVLFSLCGATQLAFADGCD